MSNKTFIGIDLNTITSGQSLIYQDGSWSAATYVNALTNQDIEGVKTFQEINTKSKFLTINSGETASGVTNNYAGIIIDRGLAANYVFHFDENYKSFRIGENSTYSYNDWYLPSKNELLEIMPFVSSNTYWSSSQYDNQTNYTNIAISPKTDIKKVIPVRNFTTTNNYNVGDYGQAGIVFYISGNTYYEFAPEQYFTDNMIGTYNVNVVGTSIEIGSGQNNTNLILAALGTETGTSTQYIDSLILTGATTHAISTREDNPLNNAISVWNSVNLRFETNNNLKWNGSNLYVGGSVSANVYSGNTLVLISSGGTRYPITISDTGTLIGVNSVLKTDKTMTGSGTTESPLKNVGNSTQTALSSITYSGGTARVMKSYYNLDTSLIVEKRFQYSGSYIQKQEIKDMATDLWIRYDYTWSGDTFASVSRTMGLTGWTISE